MIEAYNTLEQEREAEEREAEECRRKEEAEESKFDSFSGR